MWKNDAKVQKNDANVQKNDANRQNTMQKHEKTMPEVFFTSSRDSWMLVIL